MPKSQADVQDLPHGYHVTELGPLPEAWRVVSLGEVFEVVPKNQREWVVDDYADYRLVTVKLYAKGLVLGGLKRGISVSKSCMKSNKEILFSPR